MFSRKELTRLIVPLVIEQLLAVTIGIADTIMVASCGEAAVSGVSLVDSINILLINIFSALATGGAIVSSQYIGRDDRENASVSAKTLIYASALLALLIGVFCLILRGPLLHLIFGDVEAEVMANSQTYFWLSALSYPFLAVYNAGAALFRTMGNSKISMLTSILMNLVNLGGNALLIYGFQMGVAGAATATLVSRILGAVLITILLLRQQGIIQIDRLFYPEFRPDMLKKILQIGVPNGLESGMFQIGKILVQSLVASFGTAAIAANAVAGNIAGIPLIPGNAVGLAMITVVGQCVGAQNYPEAKKYTLKLTGLTYAAMGALEILLLLILNPVLSIYQLQSETAELARVILVYHSIVSIFIWPGAFVLPNGLRAAGDVKFTMLVSVFSMWVFRIALSYVIAQWMNWGVFGVWVAMTIDWVVRIIFFGVRFFNGKWQNRQII